MGLPVYYNEWDPYPAAWLRNLIAAGHLPPGDVDTRSITDVQPEDLRGYGHCHFFAGIGGWPLAARLAGWPLDRPLWTGSCPCQPFSRAGAQAGDDDERHLWPDQLRLLRACRPPVWLGEQVADAIGAGWLDGVMADLDRIDYAGRAVSLPACAVDAPHARDRLWILAGDRAVDHGERARLEGLAGHGPGATGRPGSDRPAPPAGDGGGTGWAHHWIAGHDGRARRIAPGVRMLADGIPARVGRLRAYGNAIVPALAAEVMRAYLDCAP
jgi:DNA (cytosine-5)-methyltransferase 1